MPINVISPDSIISLLKREEITFPLVVAFHVGLLLARYIAHNFAESISQTFRAAALKSDLSDKSPVPVTLSPFARRGFLSSHIATDSPEDPV